MSEPENQITEATPPPADAAPAPPPVNNVLPPPPPPAPRRDDAPQMSTPETLSGIFFEPGRTFEALRARPRFLVAAVIMVVIFLAWNAAFFSKVDYAEMVRSTIENSPQAEQLTPEQREQQIRIQSSPVVKWIAIAAPVLAVPIFLAIGGALYLLGSMAMGKGISYKQAISVWAYSSLPPLLLVMLANIVMVMIRPPAIEDAAVASRGMVRLNPGVAIDKMAHPILATALGSVDLFAIYGLVLAAVGLRKVARMSSGAAWTVVLGLYLLGLLFKLGIAAISGQPMA